MSKIAIRRTIEGHAYLNAGCGANYSADWNNVDLLEKPDVVCLDLRQPLPFPDEVFDAVYSSHSLEHLAPDDGKRLLSEMFRCSKAGGICRIVVPDYERACREYLRWLDAAIENPNARNLKRYRWSVLELVDQFVREKSGGKMLEVLMSSDFDEEYVRQRNGEEFSQFYGGVPKAAPSRPEIHSPLRMAVRRLRRRIKKWFVPPKGPSETGELHRWAYDRLSLRILMEEAGFVDVEAVEFHRSSIPGWDRYNLDSDRDRTGPRKPDSLYMEGKKHG